jgi:hypothetical protein
MTTYILIFILGTVNGLTTVQQEFNSNTMCRLALEKLNADVSSLRIWKISSGCYQK